MRKLLYFITCLLLLASCEKDIDINYHEIDPLVVIEGQVTNEGTVVSVRRSRSVTDSVRGQSLSGAKVTVYDDGKAEVLVCDPVDGCYRSTLKGIPGHTYQLTVDFEGKRYEASSVMPAPPVIISNDFYWFNIMEERLLVNVFWATDPDTIARNYFLYRVDRRSTNPHITEQMEQKAYRWNVFDDRGNPPGLIYRDIHCMMEKTAQEDEEDDWDHIIYDGDRVTLQLMTIDRTTYEYFRALISGQSGGANPTSNISGGCLGYFMAAGITRGDTLTYHPDEVQEYTIPEDIWNKRK